MVARASNRSAREVIDDAIRDNYWWERLCYALIVVFTLTGVTGAVVGMIKGNG